MFGYAWLRHLTLVTALSVLTAGCTSVRPLQAPTGPKVTVMTWNVNWSMPGVREAVGVIREADADIVSLQETNEGWERELRRAFGTTYPHILVRHRRGAGGQLVLSKLPVKVERWFVPATGWFPILVYTAKTPIGRIRFAGVHLRPPVSESGSWVSGYLTTGTVRLAELRELQEYLKQGRGATVILGDFNGNDAGPGPKFLRQAGYTDALREFDRRSDTWRWHFGVIPLRDRLDHVFYSRELHSPATRVIQQGKSDHFPILCTLEAKR